VGGLAVGMTAFFFLFRPAAWLEEDIKNMELAVCLLTEAKEGAD
jgi:hypothetical protein